MPVEWANGAVPTQRAKHFTRHGVAEKWTNLFAFQWTTI
jgi:hypothetical protein